MLWCQNFLLIHLNLSALLFQCKLIERRLTCIKEKPEAAPLLLIPA